MIPYSLRKEMEAAAKSQRLAPTSAQYRSEQPVKLVAAIVLATVAFRMWAVLL